MMIAPLLFLSTSILKRDLKQNKTKRNIYTESSSATSVPLQRLKLDTGTLNVIYENVKRTQNKKKNSAYLSHRARGRDSDMHKGVYDNQGFPSKWM